MKRIIICADGTWNRPEKDLRKDFPTNVLKIARAISPISTDDGKKIQQVVFYDWGLGSYYEPVKGGAFGHGIDKNIMDDYRFIVQNYNPGDELYFFGFSRGAYTVRSLVGFIYNCSILKREHANRIEEAYALYKNNKVKPKDPISVDFRDKYSVSQMITVDFIGVWDTVGALGIPLRVLGFLNQKNLFHDNKIGPNIKVARHALSIDEKRDDFKPTIWKKRENMDLKQVWFAGVHSDIGGGYAPDRKKQLLSDIPLKWMIREAEKTGLSFEPHLTAALNPSHKARKHKVYQGFYKLLGKYEREIVDGTFIHTSVKLRYDEMPKYRPKALAVVDENGWPNLTD